jgi:hypothetical protein
VAEHLEGFKTQALESPPPILLVDGMWVKIAYPTGECRLDAQGRRRAVKRKQKRGVLRASQFSERACKSSRKRVKGFCSTWGLAFPACPHDPKPFNESRHS